MVPPDICCDCSTPRLCVTLDLIHVVARLRFTAWWYYGYPNYTTLHDTSLSVLERFDKSHDHATIYRATLHVVSNACMPANSCMSKTCMLCNLGTCLPDCLPACWTCSHLDVRCLVLAVLLNIATTSFSVLRQRDEQVPTCSLNRRSFNHKQLAITQSQFKGQSYVVHYQPSQKAKYTITHIHVQASWSRWAADGLLGAHVQPDLTGTVHLALGES